jgi:hypothetical protein
MNALPRAPATPISTARGTPRGGWSSAAEVTWPATGSPGRYSGDARRLLHRSRIGRHLEGPGRGHRPGRLRLAPRARSCLSAVAGPRSTTGTTRGRPRTPPGGSPRAACRPGPGALPREPGSLPVRRSKDHSVPARDQYQRGYCPGPGRVPSGARRAEGSRDEEGSTAPCAVNAPTPATPPCRRTRAAAATSRLTPRTGTFLSAGDCCAVPGEVLSVAGPRARAAAGTPCGGEGVVRGRRGGPHLPRGDSSVLPGVSRCLPWKGRCPWEGRDHGEITGGCRIDHWRSSNLVSEP